MLNVTAWLPEGRKQPPGAEYKLRRGAWLSEMFFVGQSHQIIQTDIIKFRRLCGEFQGQGALLAFIFAIQGLAAQQHVCNFLLGQIAVLQQVTDL